MGKTVEEIQELCRALLHDGVFTKRDLKLLSCDFVETGLSEWEVRHNGDNRLRVAIEAKRRWLFGDISDTELCNNCTAARDAYMAGDIRAWDVYSVVGYDVEDDDFFYGVAKTQVWNAVVDAVGNPANAWVALGKAIGNTAYVYVGEYRGGFADDTTSCIAADACFAAWEIILKIIVSKLENKKEIGQNA